ncbi:hypothetical protein D9611_006719 [Ephemerocybe angulata]|uniref:Uncharacterized protein n=1 Tax=Ephemerocybe angulata TaxID=980116 RepID=A0A8H5C749_9AGAR|nr:hypothetical protein D9611_006719 [Tulosesus angulatus]
MAISIRGDFSHPPTVTAFVALQLLGAGGLILVVLTAVFCKHIKRWPTWYSFCFSWIISSLSYSLLTIGGQQYQDPPNATLCLIQAAGIYASPPLYVISLTLVSPFGLYQCTRSMTNLCAVISTTCATLSMIIHVLLRLRFAKSESSVDESGNETIAILVLAPYCVWAVIAIGFSLFTIPNIQTLAVSSTGTYCNSTDRIWPQMVFTVVVISAILIVIIQGKSRRLSAHCHHWYN